MKFTAIPRSELSAAIDKLMKAGGKIDQDTHNTIVSSLHDAGAGTMDHISRVVQALGKSQAKTTLLVYIKAHAPLTWSKKGNAFKLKKEKNRNPWMLANAEATPFWDYEPPKKDKEPFSAARIITKLRKQIDEAIISGEFNTIERQALRGGLAGIMVDYTESGAETPSSVVGATVISPSSAKAIAAQIVAA